MHVHPTRLRRSAAPLLCLCMLWAFDHPTRGQTPPVPDPAVPPAVAPTDDLAPPTAREAQLEARVRQLEAMVQQLSVQMSQSQVPVAPAATSDAAASTAGPAGGGTPGPGSPGGPAAGNTDGSAAESNTPGGENTVPVGAGPRGREPNAAPTASGGVLAPGQSSPPTPAPKPQFRMPATLINAPVTAKFGPGFEFKTADNEFVMQFHNLTQVDGRFYEQGNQSVTKDTFVIPRQWFMFSGRITKPYEYFVSLATGFDNVNVLDAFLNIHYDDRLQFRFGRYKTPFTYEFYTEPIQGLISPERSLFFNNFALNRSLGFMAWGRLFNSVTPLDYAVGIFNNGRNSFLDTGSDEKNVLAYLNWRPFATWVDTPLENFVFGGSVMAGSQTNTPTPTTLRTVVPTTGNAAVGVPFLTFNGNVRESGPRAFWALHAAWYYKQLSLIAEWQSGYQDYALTADLFDRTRLGVQSYYVQAAYFLTGENVSSRGVVKPLRDFDIRKGKFGPGAIELTSRFNVLNMSPNIFTAGLADPNLWTDNLYTIDTGFNWHLNQYVKFMFSWNHSVFGREVLFNATDRQKTADLFLFRFQLYF